MKSAIPVPWMFHGHGAVNPGHRRDAGGLGEVVAQPPRLPQGVDIDLRLSPWPVRDQGERGTCTAHAIVACREHLASPGRTLQAVVRLSEEYLYWATKTGVPDPVPNVDGTFIRSAAQMLGEWGICEEALWPYSTKVIRNNLTHQNVPVGSPSAVANQNARLYRHQPSIVQAGSNSAFVLMALQTRCRPVAISVPVFSDIASPKRDNWMTPLGVQYGVVIDPPSTSVNLRGHSVCVTGFVSDPTEPRGGYFVFRNSWGTSWAADAPSPGYHAPEPGYGQISATYLDKYLWEVCGL